MMFSRDYRWLLGLTFAMTGIVLLSNSCRADEPLNIVLLYADDWRHDTLGCAGNPVVKTPSLDQLAKEGVRFTHNNVTTSICGVSRATLLTGQWMSRHGNYGFADFKTPWAETYPVLMRENGYYTGLVGKWFTGKAKPEVFDYARIGSGGHWRKLPDGSKIHMTQQDEQNALEFLRTRPQDKPFCLSLTFSGVHAVDNDPLQYLPQPESMSLYTDVVVPTPKTAGDEFFNRLPPFIANRQNEGRNRWHWRFDTPERYQQYMKNYYRLVTEVDTVVGRVMQELEQQGVLDRTLVIFSTDNGYFHGEHGLADKWYPYEESIRVPLIVRDPRMLKKNVGTTNDALTLNVDLAPTMLAAAKIPAPKGMQGKDFSKLYLSESVPEWRQEFYYEHPTIRDKNFIPSSEAIVSKEWKYIHWPEFETEELYHLKVDPFEEHNLVSDDKYQEVRANLKQRMIEARTVVQAPVE